MFSPLQKREREKEREKKKITAAGATRHETFQLKCNFRPHCCRMKPGKQQKKGWDGMGYDREDMAEGGKG